MFLIEESEGVKACLNKIVLQNFILFFEIMFYFIRSCFIS